MDYKKAIKEIGNQIQQLEEARRVLIGLSGGKGKRKISAAGRKRIAAAQRARWAKMRAAKK